MGSGEEGTSPLLPHAFTGEMSDGGRSPLHTTSEQANPHLCQLSWLHCVAQATRPASPSFSWWGSDRQFSVLMTSRPAVPSASGVDGGWGEGVEGRGEADIHLPTFYNGEVGLCTNSSDFV